MEVEIRTLRLPDEAELAERKEAHPETARVRSLLTPDLSNLDSACKELPALIQALRNSSELPQPTAGLRNIALRQPEIIEDVLFHLITNKSFASTVGVENTQDRQALCSYLEKLLFLSAPRHQHEFAGLNPSPGGYAKVMGNFVATGWLSMNGDVGTWVAHEPQERADAKTGFFAGAIGEYPKQLHVTSASQREELEDLEIVPRGPLTTTFCFLLPATQCGENNPIKIQIPGKALIQADYGKTAPGNSSWIVSREAFPILAKALGEADPNVSEIRRELSVSGPQPKIFQSGFIKSLVGILPLDRHVLSIISEDHPGAVRRMAESLDPSQIVSGSSLELSCLNHSLSTHRDSAARVLGRMAEFLRENFPASVTIQNSDSGRIKLNSSLNYLSGQDHHWANFGGAFAACAELVKRSIEILPPYTANQHSWLTNGHGISDSVGVKFGNTETVVTCYHAMMIGGPTPSPNELRLSGENPLIATYQLQTGETKYQVTPKFREQVEAHIRASLRRSEIVEVSLRRLITEAPEESTVAMRLSAQA